MLIRNNNLGFLDSVLNWAEDAAYYADDLADTYITIDSAYDRATYKPPTATPTVINTQQPTSSYQPIVTMQPPIPKDNTLLYVGIGAAVLIPVLFLLLRKK